MELRQYAIAINITCIVAWITVMAPSIVFLVTSWVDRRDDLFSIMTDEVLRLYYKQFFPSEKSTDQGLQGRFKRDFNKRFGRRLYILPLTLLAAIAGIALWEIAGSLDVWSRVVDLRSPHFVLDDISSAALMGGLTWVISDQLSRFRTRDFTSHDVYNCVFRLLISIPLGYSVGAFIDAKLKVPTAFLLGAFPTATLFTIARRLSLKALNGGDDSVNGASELEKLPNVGRAFAERLKDEGLNSIAELAYSDPVSIAVKTNKNFIFITDCISQALFWIYFRDNAQKLLCLSLRGAQEANTLMDGLESTDSEEQRRATATLIEAASRLGLSEVALRQTLAEIAYDPYTEFLVEIWCDDEQVPAKPESGE